MGIQERLSSGILPVLRLVVSLVINMILIAIAVVSVASIIVSIYGYLNQPNGGLPNIRSMARLGFIALVAVFAAKGYNWLDPLGLGLPHQSDTQNSLTREDHIEQLRNKSSSDYELITEIVGENFPTTAEHLREIQTHTTSTEPFDDLSNAIRIGIQRSTKSPIQESINMIERIINTKEYVESYPDTELRIIRFNGDTFNIFTDGRKDKLKPRMVFEVRIKRQSATGESRSVPIGTARITHVSEEVTNMDMIEWRESTNDPDIAELRDGDITGKGPTVGIQHPEVLRDTEMKYLKRIENDLRTVGNIREYAKQN